MRRLSRRNFFKVAGLFAAGAAGASLGRKRPPLPDLVEGDPWPEREERWVASVCQLCPGGCGLRARVVDGRVVKVEGNPFHPVNRGRLCPVGQAAPQLRYHPDRLRSPMLRTAGGGLRRASWEEATSFLAQALKGLRDRGEAHTVVFLAGPFRGLRDRFLRRFMTAFGSPNYIRAREAAPEELDPSHSLAQGIDRPLAPDLFAARSILSFGVPLLEGGPSPVYQMRAYGHFRQGEGRPRGVLIQVEPRRSATAERADKWVAIRPGTETTLALGIAHALVLENLFDESFVARHCEGFEDGAGPDGRVLPGLRTIVLREFTLTQV
ncbi:MAG: molybdopterin-dependent oxidoreductase, partial [Candidatus Tectimicrobiota bacterium]